MKVTLRGVLLVGTSIIKIKPLPQWCHARYSESAVLAVRSRNFVKYRNFPPWPSGLEAAEALKNAPGRLGVMAATERRYLK